MTSSTNGGSTSDELGAVDGTDLDERGGVDERDGDEREGEDIEEPDDLDVRDGIDRDDIERDDRTAQKAEAFDDADVDDEGIATDRLDDASVEDPAPASIAAQQAPTWAQSSDGREAVLRKHAPWFGRIDVSITWRRALNESTAIQRDEVWLVGTWRL